MQQVEQRISKDLLMKELQKNDVNKESNEQINHLAGARIWIKPKEVPRKYEDQLKLNEEFNQYPKNAKRIQSIKERTINLKMLQTIDHGNNERSDERSRGKRDDQQPEQPLPIQQQRYESPYKSNSFNAYIDIPEEAPSYDTPEPIQITEIPDKVQKRAPVAEKVPRESSIRTNKISRDALNVPTQFDEPAESILVKDSSNRLLEQFKEPMSMRIDRVQNPAGHQNVDNPYLTTTSGVHSKINLKANRHTLNSKFSWESPLLKIVEENKTAAFKEKNGHQLRNPFNYKSISPIDSTKMKFGIPTKLTTETDSQQ